MLHEITNVNSLVLYQYFQGLGYKNSKANFDKDLFNNDLTYQRTYVYESEGEILSFIQYGKDKNNNGIIRFFTYKNTFKYAGRELLFRAATYFYIFHLDVHVKYFNTDLDKLFLGLNLTHCDLLLKEFNFQRENADSFDSFLPIKS